MVIEDIVITSRVPVEGKSSVCLICMKYRLIFLIIIIISLGRILLSYIANTSCTHARMDGRTDARTRAHAFAHTRTNACTHTPHTHTPPSPYRYSMGLLCQPTVTARSAGDNSWSLAIEINTGIGGPVSPRFWVFFAYKKMLGWTDTRTRERMYCQTIWTVRDISRDDRARIATCSLRTPTDRLTSKLIKWIPFPFRSPSVDVDMK